MIPFFEKTQLSYHAPSNYVKGTHPIPLVFLYMHGHINHHLDDQNNCDDYYQAHTAITCSS